MMLSTLVYNPHQIVIKLLIKITTRTFQHLCLLYNQLNMNSLDATDYWLMACEYSVWNAVIVSLDFWTADLDPITLGRATEHVYTTFFYTPSSHAL